MSHIESMVSVEYNSLDGVSINQHNCQPLILVVEDGSDLFDDLELICDFLDLGIERVSGAEDLLAALDARRPMAIVAELDGAEQDGCFVLMTVAAHNRSLPVLMVTGDDPALIGAVDAIEELWGLTSVTQTRELPSVGKVVDFLFRAGRRAGVTRLMPV